ncbi:MAG: putative molybdenum carrier protein [Planctomycetales bacterium]|nr:putative molybdenum carrier protein [Planctomycetales bacterium]
MNSLASLTIVSGGQTGVDRAALDFALRHGLPHGGWCPRGRRAEDGVLDARYQLQESTSRKYAQRTKWNVRDSDGTVVFSVGRELSGGTLFTYQLAQQADAPVLQLVHQQGDRESQNVAACAASLRGFVSTYRIQKLNVAGPRASQAPDLPRFVEAVLSGALLPSSTARAHNS